jgi:hypothetical protein
VQSVAQQNPGGQPQAAAEIPFIVGSNLYSEPAFFTDVQVLDGNSHEFVHQVTPGNFLSGVVLDVSSASGVIGAGVLAADAPYTVISSVTFEDISGGPILYPMTGFAAAMRQKYLQPWDGDPAKRPGFSNSVNPAFRLRLMVEVRDTLAILSNTDARAQYRIRYTIAPSTSTFTTAPTTLPTVTVKGWIECRAQPDAHDLLGHSIVGVPDGMSTSRFLMHENPPLVGGNNVVRHTLVGNEIRGIIWVVRNSLGARVDLTDANAGAIDVRLDNRRLFKRTPTQIVEQMFDFYEDLGNGTWTRETGVYAYARYRRPGDLLGEYWLQTVEQSLLAAEFGGADLGANVPGTLEIIYDELAVAGALNPEYEGI